MTNLKRSAHNKSAREKRGQITVEFSKQFVEYSDAALQQLLQHADAQTRTAAATLLGHRRSYAAIPDLCAQLALEQALYTRLALCNALGAIGEPALPELLALIGKVGHNQHQKLPDALFKKWNYPLPRDIIVRTIVKIGPTALPVLVKQLEMTNDPLVIAELVDALGHISYYGHDTSAFESLMVVQDTYYDHPVIIWKLVRACQAFPLAESVAYLEDVLLESPLPPHRWEAARSLGQIGTHDAECTLRLAIDDPHALVREMVERSLSYIDKKSYRA